MSRADLPVKAVPPLVTIGIPCFNAAATIEATLADALAQDHPELEIVVSDNGSTDRTAETCSGLAGDDPRFRLHVNEENLGWQANFRTLLAMAEGEYFMWLGADDRVAPTFVTMNLQELISDPDLVASISRVGWLHEGRLGAEAPGTMPLSGSPSENVATYLRHARDNSRFYGLYRTDVLRSCFPESNFYGLDLAIVARTLAMGNHARVDDVLMWRERTDPDSYVRYVDADASGVIDRLVPFRKATRDLRCGTAPLSTTAWQWLAVRNGYEHVRYWGHVENRYGRSLRRVLPLVERMREKVVSRPLDAGSPVAQR
ncbi:MAG: glycosyltransferase family 2 protein [Acidimicrobiales bacterium]